MSNIWSDVRQHLASLGAKLQLSGESHAASMTTILLESMSMESGRRAGTLPRRCSSVSNALGSVKFCHNPSNMITNGLISQSIDMLSSARIPGHPSTQHLVIVAANAVYPEKGTCPSQGNLRSPQRASWWDKEAHRLKEMKMQNLVEGTLSPHPTSVPGESSVSKITVRLAVAKPEDISSGKSLQGGEACPPTNNAGRFGSPNSNSINHGIISGDSRDLSHHAPSNHDPTGSPKSSTQPTRAPSIVARLQQFHGLTKKKLYGSINHTPPRTPFFKDERVDGTPQHAPQQPLIPPEVQEYINHNYPVSKSGGKVQTKSKEERRIRLAERKATSPPRAPRREKKTLKTDQPHSSPASSHNSIPLSPVSPHIPSLTHTAIDGPTVTPLAMPYSPGYHTPTDGSYIATDSTLSQPQPLASPSFSPNIDILPQTQPTDLSDTYAMSGPLTLASGFDTPIPSFAGVLRPHSTPISQHQPSSVQSCAANTWTSSDAQLSLYQWDDSPAAAPHTFKGGYVERSGEAVLDGIATREEYLLPEMVPQHNPGINQSSLERFQMPDYTATDGNGTHYACSPASAFLYMDGGPELNRASTTLPTTSNINTNAQVILSRSMGFDYAHAMPLNGHVQAEHSGVTITPLYEFHHSSSSSLSAMINPSLSTFSPSRNAGSRSSEDDALTLPWTN
ncbi:hypothetical protein P691DRAFT_774816 [Macrolepiota fuliginosa MF-IS2]|uniref:Uncharacterized protein n=1 Tax=Macrolepiota fuliginosa MF-IS2 TaxID=1400762 RepID=A0A9P6C4X0_9AGAR|nr:hypothetical protein P691DRAFT_774816 [Macrolepiota fuliginosa MF-IS2]